MIVNDFFFRISLEVPVSSYLRLCHIHQCISINMLADKLNMTPLEAERWIINLVRNVQLDAKIDSKLDHVVMDNKAVLPYQQVIKNTKSLSFKSQMLAVKIEKKLNQNCRSEAP